MPSAEGFVRIEPGQINEGGAGSGKQRHEPVKEKMLKPGPPTVTPQVLEGGHYAGGGERVALGRDMRERIEAHRPVDVSGVKVTDRMRAVGWDAIRYRLGKVAVRVDHGDPLATHNVVHGEIEQHRALARTRTSRQCRHASRAPRARGQVAPRVVLAMWW